MSAQSLDQAPGRERRRKPASLDPRRSPEAQASGLRVIGLTPASA